MTEVICRTDLSNSVGLYESQRLESCAILIVYVREGEKLRVLDNFSELLTKSLVLLQIINEYIWTWEVSTDDEVASWLGRLRSIPIP